MFAAIIYLGKNSIGYLSGIGMKGKLVEWHGLSGKGENRGFLIITFEST